MAVNRRTIIKALALAPALPFLHSRVGHALMQPGNPSEAFILLHGLFFMDFSGGNLNVATPQHPPHFFGIRPHGRQIQDLNGPGHANSDLNPPSPVATTGTMNFFPTDIPQFTASTIGRPNDAIVSSATKFQYRLKLPLPKLIAAYRTDTSDHLLLDESKNVSKSIRSFQGPRLATITCLVFDPAPGSQGSVTSYYAEHPQKAGAGAVNAAFVAGQDICGPNFDLKLSPGYTPDANRDPEHPGVAGDDEATIEEVNSTLNLYTAMFELERAEKQHSKNASVKPPRTASSEANAAQLLFNADIASCPQLGINYP